MSRQSQPNSPEQLPDRSVRGAHSATDAPAPEISSAELLQGHRELLIHHEGETYRLRLTRTGKLILNK